jgi:diadenosine tetraphosphatase ApaH/serine/threonine PP2A family protein phosphatase
MEEDAYIPHDQGPQACFRFLEEAYPEARICFFGHTHDAGGWYRSGTTVKGCARELSLAPKHLYLINPGSVGQPRDGIPEASFGIFDSGTGIYRNLRIAYDVEAAQRKILDAGLPEALASRLSKGR